MIDRLPRVSCRLCVVVLAAWSCVFSADVQAGPRDELRELRGRIESLQKRLAESEESRTEAANALKSSERAIGDTLRKLDELVARRRATASAVAKLQGQAGTLQEDIAAEQETLGNLLYRQYVDGPSDALKLVLNGEDPNEIARQFQYLGYISRARAGILSKLRADLAALEALSDKTRRKGLELRALQNEETEQVRRLESEKARHETLYARVSADIENNRKRLSTLKQDEQRLTQLIRRLAAQSARKKPDRRIANKSLPTPELGAGSFRNLKGTLALPVIGELANRFGSPRQDSGLSWKGLFIAAKPGQEVKAVAGGKVVYADWLRGFGNLLILDHGDGYMSLYGNNETLYKKSGDQTRGGDTIATVGNSGGNPDSGLYFELRYQGKPFDPLAWTSLK